MATMNLYEVDILLDLIALSVLTVIWFAGNRKKVEINNKHLFLTMMISASTCLGADAVAYMLMGHTGSFFWYAGLFANSVYFMAQAAFCWQWFLYALGAFRTKPLRQKNLLSYIYAIPVIIEEVLIIAINPFTEIIFTIDEQANYTRGRYYNIILYIQYIYITFAVILMYISMFREKDKQKKAKLIMLALLSLTPILASIIQVAIVGISVIWPTTAMSVYIMFELEAHDYMEQKAAKEAELETELANQKIKIMMSQIQPHFLYNTLTTIRALIGQDPELAQQVITSFSTYLRTNMDSMNLTTPVTFAKELEHTQTYTQIEQLRFPDLIVEYDIQDKNFLLPALSVQPMVENAIKHGIRQRSEAGGKVTVSTFIKDGNHVVQIRDNGVGFSKDTPKDPTRSHIGLMNTKKRIEEMMNGQFIIESEKDVGTTISFLIPVAETE